jgi:sporulation protein YabP
MNERAGNPSTHSLLAVNREAVTVKGVSDVISFDESMVVLVTGCGNLALEGRDLHVTTLDTQNGVVEVTGRLSGVLYDDRDASGDKGKEKKGRSGLGRLFG